MATVTYNGDEYEVTEAEARRYAALVEQGVDPKTALAIATGDFVDINPPEEPTDG